MTKGPSSRTAILIGSIEPIDDFAIAVLAILRQGVAITIIDVEGVHLALFLKRFCHSHSLGKRDHFVGPAVEDENRHVDLTSAPPH
jgi:hypothetical protein